MTRDPEPRRIPAPVLALAAAALFGASTPLVAPLVQSTSPVLIAGLLYLGSAFGLGAWWLIARPRMGLRPLPRTERSSFLGAILFGGVLGPALLMLGLRSTGAASAALLLNLEIVFTALIAWALFRENAGSRVVVGMALLFAGATLLAFGMNRVEGFAWGALAVVAACLCWAIDNNLTRDVPSPHPVALALIKGAVAGPINIGLALLAGAAMPKPAGVGAALLIGAAGYGASLVLFISALRELGSARTAAYFASAPFAGVALALVIGAEAPPAAFWLAVILMATGVWLHLSERHLHVHKHEALAHDHEHVHDLHHQHEHEPGQDLNAPHRHLHRHELLTHTHRHTPDLHHRHH
ncbi:MAG: EamA family transporter [Hyphomonadaceae bacterium]